MEVVAHVVGEAPERAFGQPTVEVPNGLRAGAMFSEQVRRQGGGQGLAVHTPVRSSHPEFRLERQPYMLDLEVGLIEAAQKLPAIGVEVVLLGYPVEKAGSKAKMEDVRSPVPAPSSSLTRNLESDITLERRSSVDNVVLPPHRAERLSEVESSDVVGKLRQVELAWRVMVLLDNQAVPPKRLAG